jgi:thymidylate synthase
MNSNLQTCHEIRQEFARLYKEQKFVTDKSGVKTVEIMGASFWANSPLIFGAVNQDYVQRELDWYKSQSLNVNDIPGGPPAIWKQVADKDGMINSNYGWCVYSEENNDQFWNVVTELEDRPDSRRAIMIYTRPSMWGDHNRNGRSDFMCTNTVQYMIRNGRIHAIVNMRSNDAWAGYRNDYAWQEYILQEVVQELRYRGKYYERGEIMWNAGSLHIYERQFYLLEHYLKTGDLTITKEKYDKRYNKESSEVGSAVY